MTFLIRHARILTLAQARSDSTSSGGAQPRRGAALRDLGIIPRGDVLVREDKIVAIGTELDVPPDAEVIEADGRVLMPGFVDCHTHACWAGERIDDWERQLNGSLTPEVLNQARGIQATVR